MRSLKLILTDFKFFAPVWVFASLNIVTGTWVLYLPFIKTKFGLNDGQIGLALFFLAFGILLAIPLVPIINNKIGLGRSTFFSLLIYALLFNLPLVVQDFILLCSSLFIIGVFSGFTDVSMNALVSTIEKREGTNFMSAAHGFFSLGGFLGAGLGSVLIGYFMEPIWHMSMIFAFVFLSNIILVKHYYQVSDVTVGEKEKTRGIKKLRPLLVLAIVAFIIMCNEGAVEHWSNLFLFDVVKVSQGMAGLGFIAFSLFMTLGRFLGDGISEKYGAIKVIVYGCAIAIGAYFLILTSHFYISVIGFGLLGLGLSVIIPELFRLAGRTKNLPTSVSISFVSGVGFLGFLLGPVIIGFISNFTNLLMSYVFLTTLVVLALSLTHIKLRANTKQS